MSKMDTKDFFIGAVVGGIIGAASAILLAPKSGKELRSDINEKAATAKDKTIELTNNAVEKGNMYSQVAKEQWDKLSDKTRELTGKVSDEGEHLVKGVRSSVEEQKETGKKLAEKVVSEMEETKEKLRSAK